MDGQSRDKESIRKPGRLRPWKLAAPLFLATILIILGPALLNLVTRHLTRFALEQGNPALAETVLSLVVRLKPGSAQIHDSLGYVQYYQGKNERAEASFRRAIELDGTYPVPRSNLGVLLLNQGDLRQAIEHFQEAVKLDPASGSTYFNLANAYLEVGDREAASETYRLVIELDPDQREAQANWASLELEAGRVDPAQEMFTQILAANPKHALARRGLGVIEFLRENPAQALEELRMAAELDPYDPVTRFYTGLALEKLGKLQEAEAEFERAVFLGDDESLVRQAERHLLAVRTSLGESE
jgi:Flp pilus assembly protein TadD